MSSAEYHSQLFSIIVQLFRQRRMNRHHFDFFYRRRLFQRKIIAGDEPAKTLLEFLALAGQSEIDKQLGRIRVRRLRR